MKKNISLESFKHEDWVKIYDGRWSFLTSSHFGDMYTKEFRFGPRPFMPQTIILVSHNRSSGWVRQSDRGVLGNFLANQVIKKPVVAKEISKKLEQEAKSFLLFIDKHENTIATPDLYTEFWERLASYYHVHINVKYVVDYLPSKLLKKYLPALQKARLVAEPVLNRTEDFLISFAKLLGKQTKYNPNLLLCLTKQELKEFFKSKKLPKQTELKIRCAKAAFLHNQTSSQFFTGIQAKKIDQIVQQKNKLSIIKGFTAFPGKVVGTVRIVNDPKKVKIFNLGDILVSGSTRPEFLALMHKAAAFVTDAGGILSHASITAREMKKPCVIGTNNATKILQDGDKVEVDADSGMVRKL